MKALRSKAYKQTTGQLKVVREEDGKLGHCCLGVASEVAKQEGVIKRFSNHGDFLPLKVAQWLGVKENPILNYGKAKRSATSLNDDKRLSFEGIADCIEKTYDLVEKPRGKRIS